MLDLNTLDGSAWDVVISGTGLPQALLALALSRSGKKILHVDKNEYYGGTEAAFSLQEFEEWVMKIDQAPDSMPFEYASISRPSIPEGGKSQFSFARAYSLSLSPQLLFAQSSFLPSLVASKVYRQLEFQAVGSWWVYDRTTSSKTNSQSAILRRVPSNREDVFSDDSMSTKSKRSLMKFLRHFLHDGQDGELQPNQEQEEDMTLHEILQNKYRIPSELFDPILSLSLSFKSVKETSVEYALPNIKRHLGSIGVFGPGFGAVLAKWGGGAEFSQAACRACAVGGGIYALDRGIKSIDTMSNDEKNETLHIHLTSDELVRSRYVVGSEWDLPQHILRRKSHFYSRITRTIMIVNSPLEMLFPPTSENGPVPAGSVVTIPSAGSGLPAYLLVHSSDTGECPVGQCLIYGYVLLPAEEGRAALESSVDDFLRSVDPNAAVIWSAHFTQLGRFEDEKVTGEILKGTHDQCFVFPAPSLDLAFEDALLDQVKAVWEIIMGNEADEKQFLKFDEREGMLDGETNEAL